MAIFWHILINIIKRLKSIQKEAITWHSHHQAVEVTIIDESNYLPAATNSVVPYVLIATAQNKVSGAGVGVAAGTTAANANKCYLNNITKRFGSYIWYTILSTVLQPELQLMDTNLMNTVYLQPIQYTRSKQQSICTKKQMLI